MRGITPEVSQFRPELLILPKKTLELVLTLLQSFATHGIGAELFPFQPELLIFYAETPEIVLNLTDEMPVKKGSCHYPEDDD